MPPSSRDIGRSTDGRSLGDGERARDESNKTTSLLIVVLSLVFVAIFGGALVGGILSGDPTNAFFVTIIVASVVAISVALGVSVRYIVTHRPNGENDEEYLGKENVRNTFSGSDEENHSHEEYPDYTPRDYCYPNRTPVESEIKEIEAKSVFGEMSALSPTTYEEGSCSTFRHHIIKDGQRGFDFSSITEEKFSGRQDPPEGAGLATIQSAWNARGSSQDPSAPKFSTDGGIIVDDEYNREGEVKDNCNATDSPMNCSAREEKSILSRKSGRPRCDPDNSSQFDHEDNTVRTEKSKSSQYTRKSRRSRSRSRSKSKSPSTYHVVKSPAKSEANSFPVNREQKRKEAGVLHPHSTKSVASNSVRASSVPSTPAASETGSFASSFFKPLNDMFAKSKKSSSEVGASDTSSSNKIRPESHIAEAKIPVRNNLEGRPPIERPPIKPSNRKEGDTLRTIGGHFGPTPLTPANNSTFTIPPPRPIPRTPMGSEVFSEFQSMAGSTYSNGVASSTFDPQARERALQKMRKNQAAIGASPVDGNAMPIYYNDDDDKESSVAANSVVQSNSYDVFAPPGALGIVVDTTDKGCIVYSLKKSSPMQGLMNRGDLIIGLDNFDVKNMSAASLTKLMAKKSEQEERKFTLVPKS